MGQNKYKHVIRPDGSIRVAGTGGKGLVPRDDEILVTAPVLRQPGLWFYDFVTRSLVQHAPVVLEHGRAAARAGRKAADDARLRKLRILLRKIGNQSPEIREILTLMFELTGLQKEYRAKKK